MYNVAEKLKIANDFDFDIEFLNSPLIHEDHGDFGGCAGPLRCGKGTTWEGGQRVPGLISYPGHIEPGTSHALTTILDIMPTIMSIVGGDMPDDGVSYDLSDLLFNGGEVKLEL